MPLSFVLMTSEPSAPVFQDFGHRIIAWCVSGNISKASHLTSIHWLSVMLRRQARHSMWHKSYMNQTSMSHKAIYQSYMWTTRYKSIDCQPWKAADEKLKTICNWKSLGKLLPHIQLPTLHCTWSKRLEGAYRTWHQWTQWRLLHVRTILSQSSVRQVPPIATARPLMKHPKRQKTTHINAEDTSHIHRKLQVVPICTWLMIFSAPWAQNGIR